MREEAWVEEEIEEELVITEVMVITDLEKVEEAMDQEIDQKEEVLVAEETAEQIQVQVIHFIVQQETATGIIEGVLTEEIQDRIVDIK
jgi:hypothetical protein